MDLIRPNGLIERLTPMARPQVAIQSYGRSQPGAASPEAMRSAALQDRRQKPRRKTDPLRGRLLDLTA